MLLLSQRKLSDPRRMRPKKCILNAFKKSPLKLAQIDLVKKQEGHGIPVACLIGQLYPGSQGNFCFKNSLNFYYVFLYARDQLRYKLWALIDDLSLKSCKRSGVEHKSCNFMN